MSNSNSVKTQIVIELKLQKLKLWQIKLLQNSNWDNSNLTIQIVTTQIDTKLQLWRKSKHNMYFGKYNLATQRLDEMYSGSRLQFGQTFIFYFL